MGQGSGSEVKPGHPEPKKFLAVSWREIEEGCLQIAERIREDGERIDLIVGVLRGGWVPARLLSDYLGVDRIGAVEVKFYRGIGDRMERPVITQPLVVDAHDKTVLVVDDVADTGKTLNIVTSFLSLYGPRKILTATIYVKPWSIIRPDYYAYETDAWIIFPWDRGETIEELVTKKGMSLEEAAKTSGDSVDFIKRVLRARKGYD